MSFVNEFEVEIKRNPNEGASIYVPPKRFHHEYEVRSLQSISVPASSERLIKVKLSLVIFFIFFILILII
jgi:hypothetical protein